MPAFAPGPRCIEPEWLDELSTDDPRAMRSRSDLRLVNRLMLQPGIMLRLLRAHAPDPPPGSLMELGAGDGTFMLRLARALSPIWPGLQVTLVDRQNIVTPETREAIAALGWGLRIITADVFDAVENTADKANAIIANLFLHHLTAQALRSLFARAADIAPLFIACEPRRSTISLAGSHLLGLIGCSAVTRHDAVVSVRAGFAGEDLSGLWPASGWDLSEHRAGLFTHCFVARQSESGL